MTGVAPDPLHHLRINAADLLRHPGAERSIATRLSADELGTVHANIAGEIDVDLVARSTTDDVVVTGTVTVPWRADCRRCLAEVRGVAVAEFDEVYRHDPDAEAEPIVADQIDLAPALRQTVLLEVPDAPLCRDGCAGICPVCGADRNTDPCDCDTTVRDERWAALDDLDLGD